MNRHITLFRTLITAAFICCGIVVWQHLHAITVESEQTGVHAQWAEDVLSQYSTYHVFIADRSEAQTKVVLTTDYKVKDIKVLSLTYQDIDKNGHVSFLTKELYRQEELLPDCPLVLGMTFFGDMPSYGISYVDKKGITRSFSIELSGEDGSIQLIAF